MKFLSVLALGLASTAMAARAPLHDPALADIVARTNSHGTPQQQTPAQNPGRKSNSTTQATPPRKSNSTTPAQSPKGGGGGRNSTMTPPANNSTRGGGKGGGLPTKGAAAGGLEMLAQSVGMAGIAGLGVAFAVLM